jgi:hypothetical protein
MNYATTYAAPMLRPVLFVWAVLLFMLAPVFAMAALAVLVLAGVAISLALGGAIVLAPFLLARTVWRHRHARTAVRLPRLRRRTSKAPAGAPLRVADQVRPPAPSPSATPDDDPWSLDPLSPLP